VQKLIVAYYSKIRVIRREQMQREREHRARQDINKDAKSIKQQKNNRSEMAYTNHSHIITTRERI